MKGEKKTQSNGALSVEVVLGHRLYHLQERSALFKPEYSLQLTSWTKDELIKVNIKKPFS